MGAPKWLLRNQRESGSFGRNMAILTSGTAISQLVIVIAAPVLTRLYAPSDFGILAVYSAMVGVGGVLATFQYHQAIPLPKERGTMASVFILCLASILVVSLLTSVYLWYFGRQSLAWFGAESLYPYIWLIPLGIVGIAMYETTGSYAIRQKAFKHIAATRLGQSSAQSSVQIGSGLAGLGPAGLLLGQFIGQAAGSISLVMLAWRQDGKTFRQVRPNGVVAAARRFQRFPKYGTWAALLNTLSLQAPILLLSYYFGGSVTGLFALAQQVLLMPVALLSKSASQAFIAVAVDAAREDRISEVVNDLFGRMSFLGLPLAVAVLLVAPEVFATLFGDEWRASGLYAQWLSVWLLFAFLSLPLSPLIAVLDKQATGAVFQLALLVGRASAIVIGGIFNDPMLAIVFFAIIGTVLRSVFLLWLLQISGTSLRGLIPHVLRASKFALVANFPLAVSKLFGFDDDVIVVIAFGSGLAALAWLVHNTSKRPVSQD